MSSFTELLIEPFLDSPRLSFLWANLPAGDFEAICELRERFLKFEKEIEDFNSHWEELSNECPALTPS